MLNEYIELTDEVYETLKCNTLQKKNPIIKGQKGGHINIDTYHSFRGAGLIVYHTFFFPGSLTCVCGWECLLCPS